jgi:hypothetical protein
MNERIKELKHQASLWCDMNIPEQFSEEINGYGSAWDDKFAELIVGECVVMTKGYEYALGRKDELSKTMREHFGVE